MKTILVLTDFSINADYAAHYALKLAQQIEANLLLCNIYELPEAEQMRERTVWPLETTEQNSIEDLGDLSARLKSAIDREDPGLFRPEINQYSHEGEVVGSINDIAAKNQVLMAVISVHHAGWLDTLITGNHTRAIIDAADFPVMVLPYQAKYRDYKTIAFATAMNYTDINILQSLTSLAQYSDAKVLIARVATSNDVEKLEVNSLKVFFNQIPGKINYPNIIYLILKNRGVTGSLNWLTALVKIDLMVLVHRRRSPFQKLFTHSITQKLASLINKPLLIFPCSKVKETLSIF